MAPEGGFVDFEGGGEEDGGEEAAEEELLVEGEGPVINEPQAEPTQHTHQDTPPHAREVTEVVLEDDVLDEEAEGDGEDC